MVKIGDILEHEGKKVIVTATDGVNYAFAPYKEEETGFVTETPKPKRRRKTED